MRSDDPAGGEASGAEPATASGVASAPAPRPRKRRLWLKLGVPLVLAVVVGVGLWVWGTLGFVYSSGERTGYVRSLSERGWLCKTWEGELSVPRGPALADTTFRFTIPNDSVARALQLAAGQKVTLSFDEHRGVPSSCFGETEDYVQRFRIAP